MEVNLKDNGDGTYLATYTASADTKGNYRMSVLLKGKYHENLMSFQNPKMFV